MGMRRGVWSDRKALGAQVQLCSSESGPAWGEAGLGTVVGRPQETRSAGAGRWT